MTFARDSLFAASCGAIFFLAMACKNNLRQASGGMIPTILPGDDVRIDKVGTEPIRRGDLVVVRDPGQPKELHVRRVIGLPRDHVRIEGTDTTINGWKIPRCRAGNFRLVGAGPWPASGDLYVEFLGNVSYLVFIDSAALTHTSESVFDVAAGNLFVLGDNRLNSVSSVQWGTRRGVGLAIRALRLKT